MSMTFVILMTAPNIRNKKQSLPSTKTRKTLRSVLDLVIASTILPENHIVSYFEDAITLKFEIS